MYVVDPYYTTLVDGLGDFQASNSALKRQPQ